MSRNHLANSAVAALCASFVGGVYFFSQQAIQPDEFLELEEEGKVRAHTSGLKATIKPDAASPLERELAERPISTILGLHALTGEAGEVYRPTEGQQEAMQAADAARQGGDESNMAVVPVVSAALGAERSESPLEVPEKTGARRYFFFGPRE